MPLALLAAPPETELLVMEMAMRGIGQIAELCEIAEPDVAAITNVGPVHLELLGTLDAIVEAKAEIIHGLGDNGRAVIPEDEEALTPHLRDSLEVFTFGPGGDVFALSASVAGGRTIARDRHPARGGGLRVPVHRSPQPPQRALRDRDRRARSISIPWRWRRRTARIEFSRLRGERIELPGRILLLNDCYNANPISMRAAVENLAGSGSGEGRTVAVLGGMAELGPDAADFHCGDRRPGPGARDRSPDRRRRARPRLLAGRLGAGRRRRCPVVAAELREGDVALVKGSRSVGLERLSDGLVARLGGAGG